MKAITVKQPWASLIVEGIKDIENRTAFFKWGITDRVFAKAGHQGTTVSNTHKR